MLVNKGSNAESVVSVACHFPALEHRSHVHQLSHKRTLLRVQDTAPHYSQHGAVRSVKWKEGRLEDERLILPIHKPSAGVRLNKIGGLEDASIHSSIFQPSIPSLFYSSNLLFRA